jgi:preprotein translocase subunit SecF
MANSVMDKASSEISSQYAQGKLDVVKQMFFYIGFSLLITLPGLVVMVLSMMTYPNHAPMKLGIDFTGGVMYQYGFEKVLDQETDIPLMREKLEAIGIHNAVIQLQSAEKGSKGALNTVTTEPLVEKKAVPALPVTKKSQPHARSVTALFAEEQKKNTAQELNDKAFALQSVVSIRTQDMTQDTTILMQNSLKKTFGRYAALQKNRVGPTLAQELFTKAGLAFVLAFALIVVYLTFRFQLDYAVMAIIALLHDTLFMLGAFSILGYYFNIEIDSMFVTAILTVVGFSVHDTIVVFDRIRENARVLYAKKLPFSEIVNISLNQTVARSINTSLTAFLTLLALYFFGGDSTKNFVLAMILGIVVGTYSSIFVASSLLAWWRRRKESLAVPV